jgi:hypothetical protein
MKYRRFKVGEKVFFVAEYVCVDKNGFDVLFTTTLQLAQAASYIIDLSTNTLVKSAESLDRILEKYLQPDEPIISLRGLYEPRSIRTPRDYFLTETWPTSC